MSQRFRYIDRNERNPGPGSYIRFSEFGILNPKYKVFKDKDNQNGKGEENKNETSNLNETSNQNATSQGNEASN